MEWYVTRLTLNSIAMRPLAHATGSMILDVCNGPFGRAVVAYLEERCADWGNYDTVLSVRDYLLERNYTLSLWAYRAIEDVPADQGDVYRIAPDRVCVLFEDPRVRRGAFIAVAGDLNPRCEVVRADVQKRYESGNRIVCEDENLCRIYAPGSAWVYQRIGGERVLDAPGVEQRGDFYADEETRIAVARRLQALVDGVIAIQLANANVIVNPGWSLGSATVSGVASSDPAIPFPIEQCSDALMSVDPSVTDIVHVTAENQSVCLPRRDIDRYWEHDYTGFGSLSMHPIGTAVIRSWYPTYTPCQISFLAAPTVREAGWCRLRTLETFFNIIALDVIAITVAIGRKSIDEGIYQCLMTMFHEQAHRAEMQAGITYGGRWGQNGVGHSVAVGSEHDADSAGMCAANGMLIEDYDRVSRAIRTELDPRVEKAMSFVDIRWMKMVKERFPEFVVRLEGVDPSKQVVYGVIEGSPGTGETLREFLSTLGYAAPIKEYDHATVIVRANVGMWLEDDYRRHQNYYSGSEPRYTDADPEPDPIRAPLRGRRLGTST